MIMLAKTPEVLKEVLHEPIGEDSGHDLFEQLDNYDDKVPEELPDNVPDDNLPNPHLGVDDGAFMMKDNCPVDDDHMDVVEMVRRSLLPENWLSFCPSKPGVPEEL